MVYTEIKIHYARRGIEGLNTIIFNTDYFTIHDIYSKALEKERKNTNELLTPADIIIYDFHIIKGD